MKANPVIRYKPKLRKTIKNIGLGLIALIGGFFGTLALIASEEPPVGFIIFGLLVTLWAYSLSAHQLLFPFLTSLSITKDGFMYRQPLFMVNCGWQEVTSIFVSRYELTYVFDEKTVTKKSYIPKFIHDQKTIPVDLFVSKHHRREDWQKEPVLVTLKKYAPESLEEIVLKEIENRDTAP
jgi:hypothetical protein